MKRMLMLTALILLPGALMAQSVVEVPGSDPVKAKTQMEFDLDNDGSKDRIIVADQDCEAGECPVILFTAGGGVVTLGYAKAVETGHVSPEELGVNDPDSYPDDVPVVRMDGVLMAFNGEQAYPVADMISKEALEPVKATPEDQAWLGQRLNAEIPAQDIAVFTGNLSEAGGETVYSVSYPSLGNTSAWFIKAENGAEVARGFSMDYPRIYRNGEALRILSVSPSGIGVMDVEFTNGA